MWIVLLPSAYKNWQRASEPYLIDKRRFFHAHPELSGEEVNTTAAIAQELDAMGIDYALPNDFIPGPAPCALYRK